MNINKTKSSIAKSKLLIDKHFNDFFPHNFVAAHLNITDLFVVMVSPSGYSLLL